MADEPNKAPVPNPPAPNPPAPQPVGDNLKPVVEPKDVRDNAEKSDADKARDNAAEAQRKADEAQAKVADAGKTDEQRAAEKAAQDADDARAHAAQAERDEHGESEREPTTVGDAGVIAPGVTPETRAGHHHAQKFDNDPANPKPARPEHSDPKLMTVRLTRWSNDRRAHVHTFVHPEMIGDYLRAGWSRAI